MNMQLKTIIMLSLCISSGLSIQGFLVLSLGLSVQGFLVLSLGIDKFSEFIGSGCNSEDLQVRVQGLREWLNGPEVVPSLQLT